MVALDAEIHLKGPGGWRAVKASDFFQDLFTVDMAEDEVLVAVQIAPAKVSAYAKLHQRASHYAIVGVAAALEVSNGTCTGARIGLTGAGSHAIRLPSVEAALAGQALNADTIAAAAAAAAGDAGDLNEDLHASAAYRRQMVGVFARRAITAATARA
jgi:carbon-monoxide dehydrogenase medium subunit